MNDHFLGSPIPIKGGLATRVASWVIIFICLLFNSSCETDLVPLDFCADPLGSDNNTYKNGNVFCYKDSFNSCFTLELTTTKTNIRAVNYAGKELAMIQDIGPVTCLSEVKTKPISAYVYTVNAVLGHGYVIKLPDGTYGRFFIDSWIKPNTNVVVEINITRQYSF